jgi:Flp pilus assembly protein TadG
MAKLSQLAGVCVEACVFMTFWQRFFRNPRGNLTVITAIIMPIAVICMGFALDLAQTHKIRQELEDAADSAALTAVAQSTIQNLPGGLANTDGLKAAAIAAFNGNASGIAGVTLNSVTVEITPLVNGVQSTVSFNATYTPGLGQMVVPTITITGQSKAEDSLPKYVNFYLALDVSQSMGIGATQTDMTALQAKTPDRCAFGCHLAINSGYPSYWQIARNNNILLRIDSLRDATQQLIDTAVTKTVLPNQFKIGLYTMHKQLATLVSPTSNLATARSAAGNIDLGAVTSGGDAQTAFDVALPQLNNLVTTSGNGLTSSTPMGFVFIITDGVTDQVGGSHHPNETTSGGGRYYSPLDPALCTSFKNKGLIVGVLYTTYLPITNNSWYNTYVNPFQSKIATSLQACASSGFFFTATTDAEIHSQLQTMFLNALQTVRISA